MYSDNIVMDFDNKELDIKVRDDCDQEPNKELLNELIDIISSQTIHRVWNGTKIPEYIRTRFNPPSEFLYLKVDRNDCITAGRRADKAKDEVSMEFFVNRFREYEKKIADMEDKFDAVF